jgi:hypothetical protein
MIAPASSAGTTNNPREPSGHLTSNPARMHDDQPPSAASAQVMTLHPSAHSIIPGIQLPNEN